ncbi:hypothetical protein HN014_17720 [Aquimarina sp. TRL1]|uniref:hypothetical protein n=1 Tax=Aquimarina sp. (strain TRL1) TaxID=2736252 RepID=UPI00158C215D|nr:hypothetical protein [Aquimarina sp. TRL1]QKX06675.1 hypothetical protein HN014_17720 [Aquimarina sp. TRL1]
MKKALLLIIAFATVLKIQAQQDQSINGVLTINKNISQTTNPYSILKLKTNNGVYDKNNGPAIEFSTNIGLAKIGGVDEREDHTGAYQGGLVFKTRLHTQGNDSGFYERMRIKANGNIGIGTVNPQKKLQISNKGASTSDQTLRPEKWQAGIGHADGTDQGEVLIGTYGKQPAIQGHGTGTSYKLLLNPFNGNVGIGTTNPGSWKLAVNGKVRAKEVKVETNWSDFVFYDDYQLPTLEQVEKYIAKMGHLKDIPSAKEVKENGIFLGEMNAKLLQKIEELTLYTIAQEKKLKEQATKIEKLQSLNDKFIELQSKLEKLETKD